jgi:eukaryotic-like serine/threonine-protein kinase
MPEGETLIGKSVGHYQVVRSLGVGGMGAVYLGEHPEIQSRVAIKVLLQRFVESPQITRRFLDEARAVNRIDHAGIVRIHDCGRQEGVGVYLVMELLEGKTLQEHLDDEGPFTEERTIRVLRQTASALAASHQAGIIHRDLKPSNVFLVPDSDLAGGERVKILDFGIAKLLEGRTPSDETQTGMLMGSPLFMSPEQCIDPKRVDARADIYSLGAIGYLLLTGRHPFEAETLGQLILKQQQGKLDPLRGLRPEVSERLEAILHRALAADPDQRFTSMTELRDALGGLIGLPSSMPRPLASTETVSDTPTGITRDTPLGTTTLSQTAGEQFVLKAASGRRRMILGTALILVMTAGGFIVWRATARSDNPDPGPGSSMAGAGSAAPLARSPDARLDLAAAPDATVHSKTKLSRAPDAAPAAPSKRRPIRAPDPAARKTPLRPDAGPAAHGKKPEEPRPKGKQDDPKKEEKKPYFDDDL